MAVSYTVTKISDSHYRLAEGNVFMELLLGNRKALLIDTGYGFGDLKKAIRGITGLPLIIVNTHAHPDHACGNWQFNETVWIHQRDLEKCSLYNTPQARLAAMPQEKPDDFMEAAYLQGGIGNLASVKEGQVFDLGGFELEIVDLPGHTGGSIGLMDRRNRRLFVGDAMNTALFLFQEGVSESLEVYKKTLEKAKALPVDTLWASHAARPADRNAAIDLYFSCAEAANFEEAFPCGTMLGTEDVRLFVSPHCRADIDPDNVLYSVYATGLTEKPGFCGIFLSKHTV